MKLYKHWATEKQTILIDGSNVSVDDARSRAKEKAEKIKRKVKEEKHLFSLFANPWRDHFIR